MSKAQKGTPIKPEADDDEDTNRWQPDNLLGIMSYRDQQWANNVLRWILWPASCIGFTVGCYFETFWWTAVTVLGSGLLCALLTIPNWRQREEEAKFTWLDSNMVQQYYRDLIAREEKKAAMNKSAGFWAKIMKPKPSRHGLPVEETELETEVETSHKKLE